MTSEVVGEVEKAEDGVLVLRRIAVTYTLRAGEAEREVAERVHGFHKKSCPVYRSLMGSIDIETELVLAP